MLSFAPGPRGSSEEACLALSTASSGKSAPAILESPEEVRAYLFYMHLYLHIHVASTYLDPTSLPGLL